MRCFDSKANYKWKNEDAKKYVNLYRRIKYQYGLDANLT